MIEKGYIFEIQRLSTEDGPGIRSTVFFKGCPLKCVWCHNPESIDPKLSIQWFEKRCIGCFTCVKICPKQAISFGSNNKGLYIDRIKCDRCGKCLEECPTNALQGSGKWWSVEELFNEVNKDRAYFQKSNGGITLSGGEPTMQPEFCKDFAEKCHQNGLHVALDTCGLAPWSTFEKILACIDLLLFDLKEMNPTKHQAFTQSSNELILANAQKLTEYVEKHNGIPKIWIRTPIIPNHNDTEENIRNIAQFIKNEMKNRIERWDLLAFNNLAASKYERLDLAWPFKGQPLLTPSKMQHLVLIAQSQGIQVVHWSGLTKNKE